MLKSETTTIEGTEYTTTQFPAMTSFELLAKLVKQVGPALALMASVDADTPLESLAGPLMQSLSGLEPAAARTLVTEILANTQALIRDPGGKLSLLTLNTQENINLAFSGKLKHMFLVLGHALKVNYGDFSVGSGSDPSAPVPAATTG